MFGPRVNQEYLHESVGNLDIAIDAPSISAIPPPDAAFLEAAWAAVAEAARKGKIAVILGTERVVDRALLATALAIRPDGTIDGFQDKVQLDPSEERTYSFGSGRRVFRPKRRTSRYPSQLCNCHASTTCSHSVIKKCRLNFISGACDAASAMNARICSRDATWSSPTCIL